MECQFIPRTAGRNGGPEIGLKPERKAKHERFREITERGKQTLKAGEEKLRMNGLQGSST
jgi:hypothetical protein